MSWIGIDPGTMTAKQRHRARKRGADVPLQKRGFEATDPEVRFWRKVDTSGECWVWLAGQYHNGYGKFHPTRDKPTGAHRFSYELHFGPIPDGLFVCHRCDVPQCVRPTHLFLGSNADNVDDMWAKDRGARGWRLPHTKLTAKQVTEIRSRLNKGERQMSLAQEFSVSKSRVSQIGCER